MLSRLPPIWSTLGHVFALVIFTPAGEDFFCAEPVSHCTDAFNLAAAGADGTGMAVLAPGAELSGTVTLSPETGPLDRMPGNP